MRSIISLILLSGCGASVPVDDASAFAEQAEALAAVDAPLDDTTVAGAFAVSAPYGEGASLVVAIDGVVVAVDHEAPLQLDVDTTGIANGLHSVTITAIDPRVRMRAPEPRRIWISNDTHGREISPHLRLGVPDASSALDHTHYLLTKRQLAASYNDTRKQPNWVSWEASKEWLGSTSRSSGFKPDALLPPELAQPTDDDYKGSGFDRGHMCPSADRTLSREDNEETFRFSNAIPQQPSVNQGQWNVLEGYIRELVRSGEKRAYVISGTFASAGDAFIGNGVAVPEEVFKVAAILDANDAVVKLIAVRMPNRTPAQGTWRDYQVRVRDLEYALGLNFLSDLPPATQDALERAAPTE